jgi:hypothetical protein
MMVDFHPISRDTWNVYKYVDNNTKIGDER